MPQLFLVLDSRADCLTGGLFAGIRDKVKFCHISIVKSGDPVTQAVLKSLGVATHCHKGFVLSVNQSTKNCEHIGRSFLEQVWSKLVENLQVFVCLHEQIVILFLWAP